jgi:aerobic carbon-monoxide dehydrogenase medium subunit
MVVAGKGICHEIKIALGAVSPTPMRAKKAEAFLKGKTLTKEIIRQAASMAADESRPISDHRASNEYRRDMVAVLAARAIEQSITE